MWAVPIEDAAQGRNLDRQIALPDGGSGPHRLHDPVPGDQLAGPFDQEGQHIESARAERNRRDAARLIELEQTAAIEAEAFENQDVGCSGPVRTLVLRLYGPALVNFRRI